MDILWWPRINIDSKAKYPWFKASALHLVGSAGYTLLWAAQTNWSHPERSLSTTIYVFEPTIEEKNNHYMSRNSIKWFCNMTSENLVVTIDDTWSSWEALSFVRCQKMGQLKVSLKRYVIFLMWNSNAARKMGKSNG